MKVKVYSTPTCPYCKLAKAYLSEKGIDFQDIDVSSSQSAAEDMVKATGQMGVPVVVIGDQFVVGFDKSKIESILENSN